MSKYNLEPISLKNLSTIPIADRGGKVTVELFGEPHTPGSSFETWLERLPRLLAADQLRELVKVIRAAREKQKPVIWGMGGHVVKCGLTPVLLDLMRRGFVQAFVMNGSTAIHDFEIAIAGCTSEDVEAVLPDGRFGSAEETGREMNIAIREGAADGLGWGEALGRRLQQIAVPALAPQSLLHEAYRAGIP
ncbi:MAG: deoxyhypusine synthase family protein [Bryobacterales bacterium]|nr:deoxyhypusine synthase family protein [Bryobacterales bacterium]